MSASTPNLIFWHPDMERHITPQGQPECAERLTRLLSVLRDDSRIGNWNWVEATEATVEAITTLHTPDYVAEVESICAATPEGDWSLLDGADTWVMKDSYRAARLAVGAGLAAVDAVCGSDAKRAFCAVRPPGHHARASAAMGFCIFGNVALAARHAQRAYGLNRILVVDWDVHHGNGTQEMFYHDMSVLVFTIHQFPHWPFSGMEHDRGAGLGRGFNINVTMPAGADGKDYEEAFSGQLRVEADRFAPELVLISAGFDAHRLDPLGGINLETEDFARLTERVVEIANRHSGGRVISFLEGGYHHDAMPESVAAHLKALAVKQQE